MKYIEKIIRTYKNMVTIEYEYINSKDVYIHNIKSIIKQEGNGTRALQEFTREFAKYNIYLYASNECGTDEKILFRWYENNGFKPCNKDIKGCSTTHCKMNEMRKSIFLD